MSENRQFNTNLREIILRLKKYNKPRKLVIIASLPLILVGGFVHANTPFTTPTEVNVGNDGAANLNIPIVVPPGTNGIQPKLSLHYNSNTGNGIAGLGWTLSGTSKIQRCGNTLAQDGVKRGVKYDTGDKFCLDGQRLISTGSIYGANNTEYRTELANFAKIISYTTTPDDGPDSFKVWTKEGKVVEYGKTEDSRLEAAGKTVHITWAVNKVSDARGNYMNISYGGDNNIGEFYVTDFEYAGKTGDGSHQPYASVMVKYKHRTDSPTLYYGGSQVKLTKIVDKIETYNNNNLVKEYRLSYGSTALTETSRLNTITECDGNNTCLEPIKLTWASEFNGSWKRYANPFKNADENVTKDFVNSSDSELHRGDFNGDGLTDFLIRKRTGDTSKTVIIMSQSDGEWTVINKAIEKDGINYSELMNKNFVDVGFVYVGDFNGDGNSDIFLRKYPDGSEVVTMLSDGVGGWEIVQNTIFNDGINYSEVINGVGLIENKNVLNTPPRIILGDHNGDGLTDLIVGQGRIGDTRPFILFSNGDGTWKFDRGAVPTFLPPTVDINGDGLPDVIGNIGTNDYTTLDQHIANGDGTFATNIINLEQKQLCNHTGDFNGDGLSDLMCRYLLMDHMVIRFSKGNGEWTSKNVTIRTANANITTDYIRQMNGAIIVADFNADGLDDIFIQNKSFIDNRHDRTPLLISKGNGEFKTLDDPITIDGTNFSKHNLNTSNARLFTGDYNGDGITNFLVKNPDFSDTPIILPIGKPAKLLIKAELGLDKVVHFEYKPITDPSVHIKETNAVYPTRDSQFAKYVVSKVWSSNGNGGTLTDEYIYSGLKFDLHGRGSLGFHGWRRTRNEADLVSSKVFKQDYPYIGQIQQSKDQVKSTNRTINQIDNTYSSSEITTGAAKSEFPHITESVQQQFRLSDGILYNKVTTTKEYDDYGNPENITVSYSDGHSEAIANTYSNDTDKWLIGLLSSSEVTRTNPTQLPTVNVPSKAPPNDVELEINVVPLELGANLSPTVALDNTQTSARAGDFVSLVAVAKDRDGEIDRVEFFVDGLPAEPTSVDDTPVIDEDGIVPVYSVGWKAVSGNHEITAIAYDNKGSMTTASTSLNVSYASSVPDSGNQDGNTPPTITVTALPASQALGLPVIFTATTSDADGNNTVQSVQFYLDNTSTSLGTVAVANNASEVSSNIGGVYSYTFENIDTELGMHKVIAKVSDGQVVTFAEANFIITDATNAQPTVIATASSVSPSAGDVITLSATVSDSDGSISQVEFLIDNVVVNTDKTAPYSYDWTATEGKHTIVARATDNENAVVNSTNVPVTVASNTTSGDIFLLSLGKPTEQSSDWPNLTVHSALAVDGNYENRFRWDATNSITHTLNETNAWWQVDLGQVASIDRVKVWNRADHSDPLTNVYIFVSPTDMRGRSYAEIKADSTIKQYHHETQMGVAPDYTHEVSMDGFAGRYVRIQLAGTNQLTLAEVEVYGSTGGGTPSNTPPTVSVAASNTSPAVDDVVTLTATAADSDGSITQVEFLVDNVLVKTVLAAPYSYDWTATEGSHEIKAKATDSSNAVTTSSIVNVDVTATSNNNNNGTVELLSQGKPATQSTTLDLASSGVPTGADLAVDGNTNGNFQWSSSNSLTHTGSETENEAWWQVDLGQSASVERVKLWNRTDCCANRLQYFYIFVSDNDMTGKTVQQLLSDSTVKAKPVDESLANDVSKEFILDNNPQGRYVKIQLTGTGYLSLAEVEVFGIAGGSSGSGDTGSGGGDTTPPANQAPSVSIETPADGSSSVDGNPITITAVAGDNDGTVDSVAFYNNGTQLLGNANTAPYSITWNNAPVGNHSITAVATDDKGASTTSAAHAVSVTADTTNNGSGTTLYSEDFSGSTHSLSLWNGTQVTGLGTSTGKVVLENFNQASQNWPGYRSLQTFDYEVGQVFRAEATTGSLSGLKGVVFIEGQKLDGTNVQLRANFSQTGFSYHFVENSTWNYGGGTGTAIKANTTYIVEIEMKANGPALYVYEQGASRASSVVTYEVVNGAWSNYQLRGEGYQGPSVGGTTQLSVDNLTVSRP